MTMKISVAYLRKRAIKQKNEAHLQYGYIIFRGPNER